MATIKTRRGQKVDIDYYRTKHEKDVAAGNMPVNARGDELGPGGKIKKRAEDKTRPYYENNPKANKRVGIKRALDTENSTEKIEKEVDDSGVTTEDKETEAVKSKETTSKKKSSKKKSSKKAAPSEIIVDDEDDQSDGS